MEDTQNTGGNPGGQNEPNSNTNHEKFEPMDLEPKKPSSLVTIATVIIVVAIIIIISNAIREDKSEESETMHEGDLTVEVSDSHVEEEDINNEVTEPVSTSTLEAGFMNPSEFSDLARAEKIINSGQGKNPGTKAAEFIQAGIVPDGDEEGIYYFATSTPNSLSNFVGVYKYNIANANWHRLTKETFTPDSDGNTAMFRVVGKEGRNLIILKDRLNREVGSCESLWLQGIENKSGLFTLNIDEPLHGMPSYQLSESLRASEQEKVTNCLKAK